MKTHENNQSTLKVIGCLIAIPFIIGCSALSAYAFMILWNLTLPAIFGISSLGFYQAWGLVILLSFIGGFFRSSK